ncbi:MAG TPA: superoxide dismutase [Burkholderiales bacterium]|nr:superoxide dismutase [Burkholderiales bacterium]
MQWNQTADPVAFDLPELPYALDALEPYLSQETLEYHWGKHHRGYVSRLNDLVQGSELEGLPLEEVIKRSKGATFNNAAQAWNHAFYWKCLAPSARNRPHGRSAAAIDERFGSFDAMRSLFTRTAVGKFGSGWVWLARNAEGALLVEATDDAGTPLVQGHTPLLVCDVWEHAYYIDYRNDRTGYVDAFWRIVDWECVERNFAASESHRDDERGG